MIRFCERRKTDDDCDFRFYASDCTESNRYGVTAMTPLILKPFSRTERNTNTGRKEKTRCPDTETFTFSYSTHR